MTSRPTSIRNLPWAVVRDGAASRHVYRRDVDLFLKDGRIVEITPAGARPPETNEPALDGRGMLALPGLVNIHSHPSTEPGYRGVREDHGVPEQQMTGLMERLQAFRLGDDGRQGAATLAYSEMLRAGTTMACDVTLPFDGWLETMAQSGMRFNAAPTFASARWGMASPQTVTWKWDEAGGLVQFEKAKRVMAEAEAHNSGRLEAVVFPAQIDTVTPELFAVGRKHADQSGLRFSTHIGQSVVEVREMIRRHNMTPVQWAAAQGLLKKDTVLAHCILLDDHPQISWHTRKDLDLIAEAGASVAHCPQPFARYGLVMDHVGRRRRPWVARRRSAATTSARWHPAWPPTSSWSILATPPTAPYARCWSMARSCWRNAIPLHLDSAAAMERLAEAQARMLRDSPKHDYLGRDGETIAPLSLEIH